MLERVSFLFNFKSPKVRKESLEGRPHLVVPMVMLTEGVHAGTEGPALYTNEDLSKSVTLWNHRPIVVYHPNLNGIGVSACDPDILNAYKIGIVLNTIFADGKLSAEAWLDEERTGKIDKRVLNAVLQEKMMELSTGLYSTVERTPGEFKGKQYDVIARNHRPDHLAVLPDQVGACSNECGCGLLTNKEKEMDKKKVVDALIANTHSGWLEIDRAWLMEMPEEKLNKLVANAKKETPPPPKPDEPKKITVDDLLEILNSKKKEETPVKKEDEKKPEPKQLTEEEYINNAPPGIRESMRHAMETAKKHKKELVDLIIANKQNRFTEAFLTHKDRTLEELEGIACLASGSTEEPTYVGNSPAILKPLNNAAPVQEPLGCPSMFETPAAK